MKSRTPYSKVIHYYFEVLGEVFAIVDFDNDYIEIEEVRKNGQEDTHMIETLYYDGVDDSYVYECERGETSFAKYRSQKLEDAILAYITENGLPNKYKY